MTGRLGLSIQYQVDAGQDNLLHTIRGIPKEFIGQARPICPIVGQLANKELEVLSGDCPPEGLASTKGDLRDARRAKREVSVV
jgi:hypothetical protein